MEKRKMQIVKNKTMASMIALILALTIAVTLVALPAANAHTPPLTIPTWAYLSVQPNPVGVSQDAYVNFWIDKAPPTAAAQYGDRWQNFTVTVTKPNGSTETLGPYTSDDVGGAFITYVPNTIGNYTFVFNFPGQTIAGANPGPTGTALPQFVGDYFQPSTSNKVVLTVQQEPIQFYPSTPLPTDYWQRPIYSENLDWYKLGGNWLGLWQQGNGGSSYNASGNFQPYTTGPNSAHIVWTRPLAFGGIIGGEFGGNEYGSSYYQTPQYECKFRGIIINGVLYYRVLPGSVTDAMRWVAVDLRTGQTIWTINTTASMLCGQTLSYVSPNQFGGLAYLWSTETTVAPNTGTTYGMYDAMTGDWILNIVNGTGVRLVEADDGSLLGYYVNSTDKTLCMWNSTKCIIGPLDVPVFGYPVGWMWRPPLGASIPFSYGIQWRAPLATNISGAPISPLLSINTLSSDIVLMQTIPELVGGYSWQPGWKIIAGYSAKDGHLLWGPINMTEPDWTRIAMSPAMQGKWFEFTHETMTWSAYSLKTGEKLWGPTKPYPNVWGYYVAYPPIAAYGYLYASDFAGYVHAYNATTGALLWDFFTGTSGYETPYGTYPLLHIECVADGKVYVNGGHTYSPPLFRGSNQWCLNATTGEAIWNIAFFATANQATGVIADGYLVNENGYDNQIYCFGKGQTAITVEAPMTAVTAGDSVVMRGTVTDQSSGAKGTPAIADAYMTPWMEYLYMQQPMPTNATGVEVTLDAVDPNGNFIHIGTPTSDTSGLFSYAWTTPDVPGKYTIIATFAGSESYYASYKETAMAVQEAPATTPTPTPLTLPPTETYFAVSTIAIIIAIAVVGLMILRKRP
jgi:outer membrane protein assembly factor BamB